MYLDDFDNYDGGGFSPQPLFPDEEGGMRKKKSADNAASRYESWLKGLGRFGRDSIDPDVERAARADVEGVKSRLGSYETTPRSDEEIKGHFRDTFYKVMAPDATPERRMMLYSQSDRALDDAFDGDFDNAMRQHYQKNRNESKDRARKQMESELSVIGADPFLVTRNALKEDNAVEDIAKTISDDMPSEIVDRVRPLVRHSGYSAEDYLDEKVFPRLIPDVYEKLYDEAVKEVKPKSRTEYVIRSAFDNSLFGKANSMANSVLNLSRDHSDLSRAGLGSYESNRLDNFLSGVGSLLIDSPVFGLLGAGAAPIASSVTEKVAPLFLKKLSNKVLVAGFGGRMTPEIAERVVGKIAKNTLASKIVKSSATQGLTLGSYDLAHSIADNILEGQWSNIERNISSFGHGFLTGTALGVVGTPLRLKAQRFENMKRVFASSGVLCAESAVFTASTEARKLLEGVEVAPIDLMTDYVDAGATLLTMRLTKWRPIARNKLNKFGNIKDKYRFTPSEAEELRKENVESEVLLKKIENMLESPSSRWNDYKPVVDTYARLMSNNDLSASTRAKLLYLVENKVTKTSPIPFDFDIIEEGKNKQIFVIKDPLGRKLWTKVCKKEFDAPDEAQRLLNDIRVGRIAIFENELTDGLNSVNFLRQAGLYAKEKGIDVEQLSDILYRKSKSEPLSKSEENIVSDILERTTYDASGTLQMLYEVRREIEDECGLVRGGLQRSLRHLRDKRHDEASRAIKKYEYFLRNEVEALKSGTDTQRARSIKQMGIDGELKAHSMADVRGREAYEYNMEIEQHKERQRAAYRRKNEKVQQMTIVKQDENSKYLWNTNGAKNTKEDIAAYGKRAKEIGEKLGVNINLINDEREIPLPDTNDPTAVKNYNTSLRALGWVNDSNGKVLINLPNIKSMADLEKTVLHEAVGHKGLNGVFGNRLFDFVDNLLRKASPEVLRSIEEKTAAYRDFPRHVIIEEYLAKLAEKVSLTPKERSLYVRVKDYIKNLLIRMKLYTGSNRYVSEAELTQLMQRHCEYMMKRVERSRHRKEVFGDFEVSHRDEKGFYDHAAFMKQMHKLIDKGILLPSTSRYLRNTKGYIFSDDMSPEEGAKVNKRYEDESAKNVFVQ